MNAQNGILSWGLTAMVMLSFSPHSIATQSQTLPEFKAHFDIWIMGFNIGEAQHSFKCRQQDCTLTSVAEPPGWVKRFINESAVEKIKITQTESDFKWVSYKKFLTRRKQGDTIEKTETLIRDTEHNQIQYVEEQISWPNPEMVYDIISIAYGLQFLVLNKQPLKDIFLQDTKGQQRIKFSTQAKQEKIDLPFKDQAQTQRYHFHNDKIDANLWLMPSLNYFPVRIIILNKETDRKIELELNQKPKKL